MKKINLYSRDLLVWERLKSSVKKIIGRTQGGPKAAVESLMRGLSELDQPFSHNEPIEKFVSVAAVLTGANVLQWALRQKKLGKIGMLLAGPDVGMPNENAGAIFSPLVDGLLLPSQWVVDFCEFYHPGSRNKAFLLPAGVKTMPLAVAKDSQNKILVYQKNAPKEVFNSILNSFNQRGIPYNVLYYGRHSHDEYYSFLRESRGMIYLSQSESQGLALNEAWMFNVPTLVYNGSHMKARGYEYTYSSSAPYLTPQTGIFFSSAADFSTRFNEFLAGISEFTPRLYHLKYFNDKACAGKLINIINTISDNGHEKYS